MLVNSAWITWRCSSSKVPTMTSKQDQERSRRRQRLAAISFTPFAWSRQCFVISQSMSRNGGGFTHEDLDKKQYEQTVCPEIIKTKWEERSNTAGRRRLGNEASKINFVLWSYYLYHTYMSCTHMYIHTTYTRNIVALHAHMSVCTHTINHTCVYLGTVLFWIPKVFFNSCIICIWFHLELWCHINW